MSTSTPTLSRFNYTHIPMETEAQIIAARARLVDARRRRDITDPELRRSADLMDEVERGCGAGICEHGIPVKTCAPCMGAFIEASLTIGR